MKRGRLGRGKAMRARTKYAGIRYIKETIKLDDIEMPAMGGNLQTKLTCSFNDITDVASYLAVSPQVAIPALYSRYAITGVKYTFIPKWTTSDMGGNGLKANTVLYAINRDPQDTTSSEADLIRQNDCKFTNTNRKFTVYVKNPTPMLAQTAITLTPQSAGLAPTNYPTPTGGANSPNQVAVSYQGNKWTWLPTRVALDQNAQTAQYPAHALS